MNLMSLRMKSVKLVEVLLQYGVLAAGKALMSMVGVDCGPVRPPVRRLTEEQKTRLFRQVEALGILATRPGLMRSLTEVVPLTADGLLFRIGRPSSVSPLDLGSRKRAEPEPFLQFPDGPKPCREHITRDSNYDTTSP